MRIVITGASGFLGCHTTAAAVEMGHEVRAFVRNPEKLERALEPFGSPAVDVFVGDVQDEASLAEGFAGMDALIHTANIYSFDSRKADEMRELNGSGTRKVLQAAADAEIGRVVHVSSLVATAPHEAPVPADPPLPEPVIGAPYRDSKVAAEIVAREFRDAGHDVVITYPGQILGPYDPGPGEQNFVLGRGIGGRSPYDVTGNLAVVDVRWLGRLHALAASEEEIPPSLVAFGHFQSWTDLVRAQFDLAGRTPVLIPLPAAPARFFARAFDGVESVLGVYWGLGGHEGLSLMQTYQPGDDSAAIALAGPMPPLDETLTDAIRWLVDAGYLPAKKAGALVPQGTPL